MQQLKHNKPSHIPEECASLRDDLKANSQRARIALDGGGFSTVLADPPWPYRSPRAIVGNGGRGYQNGRAKKIVQADVKAHYPTMSMAQLKAMRVSEIVASNAHLYLWVTNGFMVEAHDLATAWGFMPKTLLTWVKTQRGQPTKPSMKKGHWYRSATEHILFCVRGKLRLCGPCRPTAFLLPRLGHSVKPDYFYDLIEEQSPGPYLELFARRRRRGWIQWGNEV